MRNGDPYIVAAGVLIALAVIGLTAFLVVQLAGAAPAVAAVLTAFAAVLAAIPPIIKALRGR
jgi:predicted tellurium resistance membrane protein TerC